MMDGEMDGSPVFIARQKLMARVHLILFIL
jgi:hypothetical protein